VPVRGWRHGSQHDGRQGWQQVGWWGGPLPPCGLPSQGDHARAGERESGCKMATVPGKVVRTTGALALMYPLWLFSGSRRAGRYGRGGWGYGASGSDVGPSGGRGRT